MDRWYRFLAALVLAAPTLALAQTVSMAGTDGIVHQGLITPDGTYAITGLATGKVQIGVASPRPASDARSVRGRGPGSRLAAPADAAVDASSWFAIPTSYQEPTTSGLNTILTSGTNKYDIDLK